VPAIVARDVERGFLLLSDLGTTTYLRASMPTTPPSCIRMRSTP
jgi:aminoglycoside/choline kinase family phosphotransferase